MNLKNVLLVSLSALMAFNSNATVMTEVKQVELATKVVLDGHVEAISEATVSAQVNAKVKRIYVDVDDRVAAGSVLIELDDTELKAQLAKAKASLSVAKAQLSQAKSEFKRLDALQSKQFVSDNDMTRATSAVEVGAANVSLAKAQITQVEQQLSYTTIIAPYSGVVTARHIEVGETAKMGQPLLSGFALNQNRLIAYVPNSLISDVERHQSLLAKSSNQNWVELKNLTIAPSADPQTHTVMVRANIDKSEFQHRPGSFIQVAVKSDARAALVVSKQAVIQQGDLSAVYVQLGEQYVLRQVVTGDVLQGQIEVLSGLAQGDKVVANGAAYLASNQQTSAK